MLAFVQRRVANEEATKRIPWRDNERLPLGATTEGIWYGDGAAGIPDPIRRGMTPCRPSMVQRPIAITPSGPQGAMGPESFVFYENQAGIFPGKLFLDSPNAGLTGGGQSDWIERGNQPVPRREAFSRILDRLTGVDR